MEAERSSEIINNEMKEEGQATAVNKKLDSTNFEIDAPLKKGISATEKIKILKERMKKYESDEKYHEELYRYSKQQKEKQTGLLLEAHIERAKQISMLKKGSKTCPF